MACPKCGQRKARRECPALQTTICTICCGTKRLTEIPCPSDCVHLVSARQHPAAVVRRQQERDVAALLPAIRHLTERQRELLFVFLSAIVRHVPDGFGRLHDDDVAEASEAVAKTLETSAKGVIYDHQAATPQAQKLARELKDLIGEIREKGATVYDGEAALTLRAIETGAREVRARLDGGETAFLELVRRLLHVNPGTASPDAPRAESGLILP
jgi:hypothetical protein